MGDKHGKISVELGNGDTYSINIRYTVGDEIRIVMPDNVDDFRADFIPNNKTKITEQ